MKERKKENEKKKKEKTGCGNYFTERMEEKETQ